MDDVDAGARLGGYMWIAVHSALVVLERLPRVRPVRAAAKAAPKLEIVWIDTPLRALLLAERCGLLTGRAADFVHALLPPYTGLRYGETIGLEPRYVQPGRIRVEWQLIEVDGRFYRTPPKVGSRRTIDTPPFLDELLVLLNSGQVCQRAAWGQRDEDEADDSPAKAG